MNCCLAVVYFTNINRVCISANDVTLKIEVNVSRGFTLNLQHNYIKVTRVYIYGCIAKQKHLRRQFSSYFGFREAVEGVIVGLSRYNPDFPSIAKSFKDYPISSITWPHRHTPLWYYSLILMPPYNFLGPKNLNFPMRVSWHDQLKCFINFMKRKADGFNTHYHDK